MDQTITLSEINRIKLFEEGDPKFQFIREKVQYEIPSKQFALSVQIASSESVPIRREPSENLKVKSQIEGRSSNSIYPVLIAKIC